MTTDTMENNPKRISQDNPHAWRNPWVIGWIALVVVVLAVNIGMISLAFITNPGLVTEDYYEKGKYYEENINKQLAARSALGWSFTTDFPTSPIMNLAEMYRFTAIDKAGMPVTGATSLLHVYRPSDADADFKLPMAEIAPGVYETKLSFPLKGIWELKISLQRGESGYDFSRRASVLAK